MTAEATQLLHLMGFSAFGTDPNKKGYLRFLRQNACLDMVIYLTPDADDWQVVEAVWSEGRQSHARDMQRKWSEFQDLFRLAKPLPDDLPPRPMDPLVNPVKI
jgi:hypothetical protein